MADDEQDEGSEELGQPTGQHSLTLCGMGEGKAWKGAGHLQYPQVREKHNALQVPKIEDGEFAEWEYGIKVGPRGGKKKVKVGLLITHEHALTKHNLAKAYAEFAETCKDSEMRKYAKVQAMAKTQTADGTTSQFAVWKDRPRKHRQPAADAPNLPEYTPEPYIPMHGQDCMCFDCLVKR